VAVQLLVPSLTVTFPVGVPVPGEFTVTVKFTVIAWFTNDGLGVWAVSVVVVAAVFTVCEVAGVDVLLLKFVSPA
jgi:hypothetical protein